MSQDTPQPTSSPAVRLLPLIEQSSNEGLANALARLLADDAEDAEAAARASITILSGIQAFLDSDGDYLVVEQIWEPLIIAKHLYKTYGIKMAATKAEEMAAAAAKLGDHRAASLYLRASGLLRPDAPDEPAAA